MTVQTTTDHGQDLAGPEGRAIGFANTRQEFDAVTQALSGAGYADGRILALQGEDGIEILKRLQKTSYFGDGEDAVIQFAIKELRAGHFALGVEVDDRASAARVALLTEPLGAHSFFYFGTWANERMTR